MKFDVFCEIQIAKPWPPNHEKRIIDDTIEQARAADEAGFEVWWQVEHHCSPEFSYSASPDLLLGAIAHNTQRLRVGHAGVLAPFKINHPMKTAARAATLDILSGGRFELGLARSGGKEWETFGSDVEKTKPELLEAFQMIPKMWTQDKFSWDSDLIKIPEREVTPHPIQKPHPRLWQTAGSPDSFKSAGQLGVGVLGTTLFSPIDVMAGFLKTYDDAFAACTQPVGLFKNHQKGVFTFVHVAESRKQAIESGGAWSALWYVETAAVNSKVPRAVWYDLIRAGLHPNFLAASRPKNYEVALGADGDPTDLTPDSNEIPVIEVLKKLARGEKVSYEEAHEVVEPLESVVVGDPDECIRKFKRYQDIKTDRMMCLLQYGAIPHEAVLRSTRLAGQYVIPAFAQQKVAAAD